MKALLALEDGFVLEGRSFTGPCEGGGEVIFNTGMTGYQEILTDPSYYGQMVCMTWPLVGNYGINAGRHGVGPASIAAALHGQGVLQRRPPTGAPPNVPCPPFSLQPRRGRQWKGIDTRALTPPPAHARGHARGGFHLRSPDPAGPRHARARRPCRRMEGQNLVHPRGPGRPLQAGVPNAAIPGARAAVPEAATLNADGSYDWPAGVEPRRRCRSRYDFGVKWNILRLLDRAQGLERAGRAAVLQPPSRSRPAAPRTACSCPTARATRRPSPTKSRPSPEAGRTPIPWRASAWATSLLAHALGGADRAS